MAKHKHSDLIKAWADGAIIQYYSQTHKKWLDTASNHPIWCLDHEYRVKPEEKKPVIRWLWSMKLTALMSDGDTTWHCLGDFFTKEEIQKKYPLAECIKLEWSRTEFPD